MTKPSIVRSPFAFNRQLAVRLCLVLALSSVCMADALLAAPPAGTAWIPTDALGVVSIRPGDVATQKNVGGIANEGMGKLFEEIGVPAEKIEQVCFFVSPPAEPGMPPGEPSAIVRLKEGEMVSPKFPGGKEGEAKDHKGVTYYVNGKNALAQVDPQTIIFGYENSITAWIDNGAESKSPLVNSAHWQSVSKQPFAAAVNFAAVTKMFDINEIPPPINGMVAPLWAELGELYLASKSDDSLKLVIIMQGREGQTLQKTKDTLTAAHTLGKNMLAGMKGQAPAGGEGPQALIGTFMDMGEELLNSVKVYDEPEKNTLKILASVGFDAKRIAAFQQSVVESQKAALGAVSLNNMRQLTLALISYEIQHKHLPPAVVMGKDGKGGMPHSWRVEILPFLEAQELYDMYNFDEPWDSETNKKVLEQMPAVFRYPEDMPDSTNSSYFAVVGPNSIFSKPEGMNVAAVTDGVANTISLVEAKQSIPWTKPVDIEISPDKPLPKLGGWNGDEFIAGFCDGHITRYKNQSDEATLRAMISIAGNEEIDDSKLRE